MYIDVHSYLSQSAIDPFTFASGLQKSHQKLRLKHFDGKRTRNRKLIKGIKARNLEMGIAILICFLWWRVKQVITCVLGHPLKTPCCFMRVPLECWVWLSSNNITLKSIFICIGGQLHLEKNAANWSQFSCIGSNEALWPEGQRKRTSLNHSICVNAVGMSQDLKNLPHFGEFLWRFPDLRLNSPESALEKFGTWQSWPTRGITPHHHITAYCPTWLVGFMFSGVWPDVVWLTKWCQEP